MSNHLGNVLVTVSDKKIAVDQNSDGTIDYYMADIITATDYYAYGMAQPGRKYTQGTNSYRYSINGQEKDKELNENITTAEYWEYDSRIGRRWNVDPKPTVGISSYSTFLGNPISHVDILGDSGGPVNKYSYVSPIKKFKYNGTLSDNPVDNIPAAVGNVFVNAGNILGNLWNSGVANVQAVNEGNWLSTVSSDAKKSLNNVSDAVYKSVSYTINTPFKQQVKDNLNALNDPQTLETGLTLAATWYGPKAFTGANQYAAASSLSAADLSTFSQVDGFSLRIFSKDYVYQNSTKAASNSRWASPTSFANSNEAFNALALDYRNTANFAQKQFSVRSVGLFIKGTAAPQGATLGGGTQLLSTPFGFKTGLTYTGWFKTK